MKKSNCGLLINGGKLLLTLSLLAWIWYILSPVMVARYYPILILEDNKWCEKHSINSPECKEGVYTLLSNVKVRSNLLHDTFYVTITNLNNTDQNKEARSFIIDAEEFVISPLRSLKNVFLGV